MLDDTPVVRISAGDAEEYTQALGQVVAGGWRQIALAERLGVPDALGFESLRDWVEARIGGYIRLSIPERREAVAELAAEGMPGQEIAEVLGVDPATVSRDLHADDEIADASEEEPLPAEALVDDSEVEPEIADASEDTKSTRELLAQSDQNDWRTPRKYLDAARAVLGGIDLDPATSIEANETVQATEFFTEDDDGLQQPWKGSVWLNPPYGGQARLFIDRLIKEYEVGNVTAACALVNSHPTETKWFQELFRYTICFIRGRIDFGGPSRPVSSTSTHGSAIVYLGDDVKAFHKHFSQFGSVVRRYEP